MYCPYLTRPPGYSVISADYFVSISLAKNVAVFPLKSTTTKGKYFPSYPKSLSENVCFPELFYSLFTAAFGYLIDLEPRVILSAVWSPTNPRNVNSDLFIWRPTADKEPKWPCLGSRLTKAFPSADAIHRQLPNDFRKYTDVSVPVLRITWFKQKWLLQRWFDGAQLWENMEFC